jgi:murein L,D-transpeptidase YcbB/YkuD
MTEFDIPGAFSAVVVGALALGLAAPVEAATEDGSFSIRGLGAQECGAIVEPLQNDAAAATAATAWLLGYTTAFNRVQEDTFDVSPLVDATAMLRMVVGTCQRAPDALVETVAFEVLRALATARVIGSTPIVETRAGDQVATVRRETLASMQSKLIELGHLSGSPDGAFGPQTAAALRAFQQEQELPQTGIADPATVVRLLVELPAQSQ